MILDPSMGKKIIKTSKAGDFVEGKAESND